MADRVLGERYRVERHLARGGMAEVYLARDELLHRSVAVKVLFPELAQDSSFVERFRREARAAAGLNHPNIVSVYDFGQDVGSYFIVMEYVDGVTLRDIIRSDGPVPAARAVEIGADIAAALEAAHRHGVIHRDVKPGNVLIAAGTVKVADFGIARAGDPRESLTRTGAVMGTATYLSPEQAQGKPIDHRSDIYSLGVVLYEMLTGRPPFVAETPVAIAYQHLSETPVPPSERAAHVPPALDGVVLKALAKDPDARQSSAERLRSELLAAPLSADAEATVVATPAVAAAAPGSTAVLPPVAEARTAADRPVPPPLAPDPVYRRRRLAALALIALLVLGGILLVALLSGGGKGTVTVPPVVNLSVAGATAALEQVGLKATVDQQPGRAGPPDQVLEQRPVGGQRVDKGTTVTLVVAGAATTSSVATIPRSTAPTTRPATSTTAAQSTTQATLPPTTSAPTTAAPSTVTFTIPVTTPASPRTTRRP